MKTTRRAQGVFFRKHNPWIFWKPLKTTGRAQDYPFSEKDLQHMCVTARNGKIWHGTDHKGTARNYLARC